MTISLSNVTVVASGVDPPVLQVTAGYELHPDGTIWKDVNGVRTQNGNWDSVANQGSSYKCKFTLASGAALTFNSAPSQTVMSTTQSFALTKGPGTFNSVVTVEIFDLSGVRQATCSVTLEDLLSR